LGRTSTGSGKIIARPSLPPSLPPDWGRSSALMRFKPVVFNWYHYVDLKALQQASAFLFGVLILQQFMVYIYIICVFYLHVPCLCSSNAKCPPPGWIFSCLFRSVSSSQRRAVLRSSVHIGVDGIDCCADTVLSSDFVADTGGFLLHDTTSRRLSQSIS